MSHDHGALPLSSPKGALNKNTRFQSKSALYLKKVCYKCLFVNTVSDWVVRHSMAYLTVQKWLVLNVPVYVKILPKLTHPSHYQRNSTESHSPLNCSSYTKCIAEPRPATSKYPAYCKFDQCLFPARCHIIISLSGRPQPRWRSSWLGLRSRSFLQQTTVRKQRSWRM